MNYRMKRLLRPREPILSRVGEPVKSQGFGSFSSSAGNSEPGRTNTPINPIETSIITSKSESQTVSISSELPSSAPPTESTGSSSLESAATSDSSAGSTTSGESAGFSTPTPIPSGISSVSVSTTSPPNDSNSTFTASNQFIGIFSNGAQVLNTTLGNVEIATHRGAPKTTQTAFNSISSVASTGCTSCSFTVGSPTLTSHIPSLSTSHARKPPGSASSTHTKHRPSNTQGSAATTHRHKASDSLTSTSTSSTERLTSSASSIGGGDTTSSKISPPQTSPTSTSFLTSSTSDSAATIIISSQQTNNGSSSTSDTFSPTSAIGIVLTPTESQIASSSFTSPTTPTSETAPSLKLPDKVASETTDAAILKSSPLSAPTSETAPSFKLPDKVANGTVGTTDAAIPNSGPVSAPTDTPLSSQVPSSANPGPGEGTQHSETKISPAIITMVVIAATIIFVFCILSGIRIWNQRRRGRRSRHLAIWTDKMNVIARSEQCNLDEEVAYSSSPLSKAERTRLSNRGAYLTIAQSHYPSIPPSRSSSVSPPPDCRPASVYSQRRVSDGSSRFSFISDDTRITSNTRADIISRSTSIKPPYQPLSSLSPVSLHPWTPSDKWFTGIGSSDSNNAQALAKSSHDPISSSGSITTRSRYKDGACHTRTSSGAQLAPPGTPSIADIQTDTISLAKLVKRTFKPSRKDELEITRGDVVYILRAFDDGWLYVEKAATSDRGFIPKDCLCEALGSSRLPS